jgi:fucose permease
MINSINHIDKYILLYIVIYINRVISYIQSNIAGLMLGTVFHKIVSVAMHGGDKFEKEIHSIVISDRLGGRCNTDPQPSYTSES